jgi:alanyl-tRNA synthetase
MLSSAEILKRYISFFKQNSHKQIANSPLVLANDPTTLFTSSGMQPLVPYLLGEVHPSGKRLVNVQNCIRAQDIEEIGDNRHTTFFRMMGNWSLGDYFKNDQLRWFFTYLTDKEKGLGLDPQKLYVTVFAGDSKSKAKTEDGKEIELGLDADAISIWATLFKEKGISEYFVDMTDPKTTEKDITNGRIFAYSPEKNWWSRAGVPSNMPPGEPGGPDAEVFYDFGTPHNKKFGEYCHPNCDCGRFMEIGNSVFMQFLRTEQGFEELPQKNVDFGGGLERLAAAVNNNPDVFLTDLYESVIEAIEKTTGKSYAQNQAPMRVIADHLKAAVFLIADGITPSNKEQGYILRRLLRRSAVKVHKLSAELTRDVFTPILNEIIRIEEKVDEKLDYKIHQQIVASVIGDEIERFATSLEKGLKEVEKNIERLDEIAFDVYQSHGFPFELLQELAQEKGKTLDKKRFDLGVQKHRDLSRTASAGKFRGGLADHQERTVMGHTATHLLHQALRDVLGNHVHQTGSNITTERVRFDFKHTERLTDEQVKKVEILVNEKIKENLPVHFELIPTEKAHTMGAIGLFMDTYGNKSKIYFIGGDSNDPKQAYSIEFCGGPHVDFTGVLKSVKIIKQENLGREQKRIYAIVEG